MQLSRLLSKTAEAKRSELLLALRLHVPAGDAAAESGEHKPCDQSAGVAAGVAPRGPRKAGGFVGRRKKEGANVQLSRLLSKTAEAKRSELLLTHACMSRPVTPLRKAEEAGPTINPLEK